MINLAALALVIPLVIYLVAKEVSRPDEEDLSSKMRKMQPIYYNQLSRGLGSYNASSTRI
jgi:hypothetical protein